MALASKTKTPSIHHKKRHGQHHKPTKTYHKTYWPYLPLIAIIVLGIGANSLWNHASHGVLGYATDMSISELLQNTNAQRAGNGELPLNLNAELDNAAQAKANSMVTLNYWSHDTPSGQPPWVFITNAGYSYSIAGENLAYGFDTSQDVITAWMGSPEHRANILNTQYKDVGFGIANSTDYQNSGPETIVVAEYGAPTTTTAAPATPAPPSPKPPISSSSTPPLASNSGSPTASPTPPAPTQPSTSTPVASTAKPSVPTSNVQPQASPSSTPVALNATPISRLQLAANDSTSMSTFTVSALALFCFFALFIRHGLIWRRVVFMGESFVVRYHALDILFVTIGVIGFLVTRNVG